MPSNNDFSTFNVSQLNTLDGDEQLGRLRNIHSEASNFETFDLSAAQVVPTTSNSHFSNFMKLA